MTDIEIQDLGGAALRTMSVNGFVHPSFFKPGDEIQKIFDNAQNLTFRDDDIMLLTYPKTGTNWMYEILSMVMNKSIDSVKTVKLQTMIEANTAEAMEAMPSPRVMNTHYPYRFLPVKGLQEKQTKTILCLRNPKDVAVSFYNHTKGLTTYDYSGQWSDWLPPFMQGKFEYGAYTAYLKELETAIKEGVGFPLHVMYYEDLKSNGLEELDRLLQFLDIELDEDLKKAIIEKCGFTAMSSKTFGPEIVKYFKDGFNFFRKGEVGNWKEWFTVAQNENFDEIWKTEMEGCGMFKFKYTI